MDTSHWFLLVCMALNLYCCGAAWLIQAANYPLFSMVAPADFVPYHKSHTRWIAPVVIIPAILTNIASIVFAFARPSSVPLWAVCVNAVLALVVLIVTFAIEVPKHIRLDQEGKNEPVIRSLVLYNWPRTLAFTAQALLMLWMVTVAFSPA